MQSVVQTTTSTHTTLNVTQVGLRTGIDHVQAILGIIIRSLTLDTRCGLKQIKQAQVLGSLSCYLAEANGGNVGSVVDLDMAMSEIEYICNARIPRLAECSRSRLTILLVAERSISMAGLSPRRSFLWSSIRVRGSQEGTATIRRRCPARTREVDRI